MFQVTTLKNLEPAEYFTHLFLSQPLARVADSEMQCPVSNILPYFSTDISAGRRIFECVGKQIEYYFFQCIPVCCKG